MYKLIRRKRFINIKRMGDCVRLRDGSVTDQKAKRRRRLEGKIFNYYSRL